MSPGKRARGRAVEGAAEPPEGLRATVAEVGGSEIAVLSYPVFARPEASLTPAEREVLAYVIGGASNLEIARKRSTALRTVANQMRSIFDKLGVKSRGELVARLAARLEK